MRERTAHHEAGHAVADYLLRGDANGVTLKPAGDTLAAAQSIYGPDENDREEVEAYIVALYAGRAAEERYADGEDGRSRDGASDDDEQAARLIEVVGGSESDYRERARSFVETNWPAIQAVARELLAHTTLDSTEVGLTVDVATGAASEADLAQYRASFRGR